MFEAILSTEGLISLLTLTLMEVVLGIDNIVFISILTGKLPIEQQRNARNLGLAMALVMRILLLLGITWIISMKEPWLVVMNQELSGRDIILLIGGLFLLYKSTIEIHHKVEGEDESETKAAFKGGFTAAIVQITLIDMVFSFDSILTAVGLVKEVSIMIMAVILSMIVMVLFAKRVSDFVNDHPTVKMLALSFLLMIGLLLVAEAFDVEVPKGYVYFAMAFSLFVEMLNLKSKKNKEKAIS